eukprot:jgi/Hompol1/5796/HPOL_004712-RA
MILQDRRHRSCLSAILRSLKKSIRFAANIECICHFEKTESPSAIAEGTIFDVPDNGNLELRSISSALEISDQWSITHQNLPAHSHFNNLSVVLDHIVINDTNSLCITVLTRNLAYEKDVSVRYTSNAWQSFKDVPAAFQASVTPSVGDYKGVDRFVANIDLQSEFGLETTAASIELAICYKVLGTEYWDNNGTQNYKPSSASGYSNSPLLAKGPAIYEDIPNPVATLSKSSNTSGTGISGNSSGTSFVKRSP